MLTGLLVWLLRLYLGWLLWNSVILSGPSFNWRVPKVAISNHGVLSLRYGFCQCPNEDPDAQGLVYVGLRGSFSDCQVCDFLVVRAKSAGRISWVQIYPRRPWQAGHSRETLWQDFGWQRDTVIGLGGARLRLPWGKNQQPFLHLLLLMLQLLWCMLACPAGDFDHFSDGGPEPDGKLQATRKLWRDHDCMQIS